MTFEHNTITVVNTRSVQQAADFSELLQARGLLTLNVPCLDLRPSDSSAVRDLLQALPTEEVWLGFTSANGIRYFPRSVQTSSYRFACLGEKTAQALRERLSSAAAEIFVGGGVNSAYWAEELLAYWGANAARTNFILARGDSASGELPKMLRSAGVAVHELIVYRSVRPEITPELLHGVRQLCASAQTSRCILTFTSSRAVENFFTLLSQMQTGAAELERIRSLPVVVVGGRTAATASDRRFRTVAQAADSSIEAMTERVLEVAAR